MSSKICSGHKPNTQQSFKAPHKTALARSYYLKRLYLHIWHQDDGLLSLPPRSTLPKTESLHAQISKIQVAISTFPLCHNRPPNAKLNGNIKADTPWPKSSKTPQCCRVKCSKVKTIPYSLPQENDLLPQRLPKLTTIDNRP